MQKQHNHVHVHGQTKALPFLSTINNSSVRWQNGKLQKKISLSLSLSPSLYPSPSPFLFYLQVRNVDDTIHIIVFLLDLMQTTEYYNRRQLQGIMGLT